MHSKFKQISIKFVYIQMKTKQKIIMLLLASFILSLTYFCSTFPPLHNQFILSNNQNCMHKIYNTINTYSNNLKYYTHHNASSFWVLLWLLLFMCKIFSTLLLALIPPQPPFVNITSLCLRTPLLRVTLPGRLTSFVVGVTLSMSEWPSGSGSGDFTSGL